VKDEYLVSEGAGRFEKRKERHTEGQQEGRLQKINERCQAHYHSSVSSVHLEKFVPFDDWVASNRCDKSALDSINMKTIITGGGVRTSGIATA